MLMKRMQWLIGLEDEMAMVCLSGLFETAVTGFDLTIRKEYQNVRGR